MRTLRNQRGTIGTVGDVLILLLVLVTIGAWWITQRKTPRTAPPSAPAAPISATPPPIVVPGQDPAQAPSLVAPPSAAGGQLRPLMPGSLPGSQHAAALEAIHALIEQGRDADAEAKLSALPQDALNDQHIRQATSVLWNNLGIIRQQSRGTAAAVPAFKAAVTLSPRDQIPRLNLAHAYVDTKDPALTREFLDETIQLAPDDPVAHLALADLLFEIGRAHV